MLTHARTPRTLGFLAHLPAPNQTRARPPQQGSSTPGVFSRILKGAAPPLPEWCSPDLRRLADWLLQKAPVMRPTQAQLFADPYVR